MKPFKFAPWILSVVLTAAVSCKPENKNPYQSHPLGTKTEAGFYYGNGMNSSFIYKPYEFQYAYGTREGQSLYRLSHTLDLRTVQVILDSRQALPGQQISAEVTVSGISGQERNGQAQLIVVKQEGSKVWLLDPEREQGFIVELH